MGFIGLLALGICVFLYGVCRLNLNSGKLFNGISVILFIVTNIFLQFLFIYFLNYKKVLYFWLHWNSWTFLGQDQYFLNFAPLFNIMYILIFYFLFFFFSILSFFI